MLNKRGDITVTILTIGILALCFFALISFYVSTLATSDNFSNIQLIEKVKIKENKGVPLETPIGGKGYYKESSSTLGLFGGSKLLLEVRYFPN